MIGKMNSRCYIFIFLLFGSCTSTSIITPDKPLRDGHVLVSAEEKFALGFFRLGNSSRRYVGIWYNKVSVQTVVWVANRDNPITNTSGVLSLDKAGNLVLFDGQKPDVVVWSTNVSTLPSVVRSNYNAELLDTGNLVVHEDNNKKGFLWQSFDHPTDTLISNMKIGVDRRSGLNRVLTSWKSPDNPGTGSYSLMINDNGSIAQLILYRNQDPLWRGGPWNGLGWTGVPEMAADFIFNISYVDNPDEVYLIDYMQNASILSRMTINESTGTLQRLTWQQSDQKWFNFFSAPRDQCDIFSHCGAFGDCNIYNAGEYECKCPPGFEPKSPHDWDSRDGSQGCVRKRKGQVCGNGEGFIKLAKMKLPDTTITRLDKNLGLEDCQDLCLKNCSCTGYSAANVRGGHSNGCITWYDKLVDLREFSGGGQDFYLRVDAVEYANYLKKSKRIPGFLKILFLVLLSAAILGKLHNGQDIAVKRLSNTSGQGTEEFRNEVTLIARLQHKNLVRLFGYCIQKDEKMLIYEYLPNKGLDGFLFDNERRYMLDWRRRFDIALGIARGMIILGRKNSTCYTENSVNLIGHVWDLWGKSSVMEIVDPSLGESHEYDPEIFRCIHIGLLCVQESATARPSMSEVVFMLCNDTSLPPPGQAAFIFRADIGPTNTGSGSVGALSANEVTISMVLGR
ncbi:G-type lectin S-receptor-like serine/threonine-protein kinase [Heracleum sosnowskyi]|uniref:non-specific serine/threonine protein kinase n=1 Tax=Heracleum sosnowskyi TaxID=360622 RepID=A0AAD8M9U1_9APIA|nr:G-type lectin S-receptor-like serine/threonine-protein kinase [Heracleum sosnowskyi]